MRSGLAGVTLAVLALAVMVLGYGSLFTVYQTHQALVVRLGQPVRVVTDPGINFKVPLIDSVIPIDKRILDLEAPVQEVIASDQKRLVVDAFARYRIREPLKFYQTVGTIQGVNSQLSTLLHSALRRVLGEASFIEMVRDERAQLGAQMRDQLDREAAAFDQIAHELDVDGSDVHQMTTALREGIVKKKPKVTLLHEVECDEAYVVAPLKGYLRWYRTRDAKDVETDSKANVAVAHWRKKGHLSLG